MENEYYELVRKNSNENCNKYDTDLFFSRVFMNRDEEDFMFWVSKSILDRNYKKIQEIFEKKQNKSLVGVKLPKTLVDGLLELAKHDYFVKQFKISLINYYIEQKYTVLTCDYSYTNHSNNGPITKDLIDFYNKNLNLFRLQQAQLITYYFIIDDDNFSDPIVCMNYDKEVRNVFISPFAYSYNEYKRNKKYHASKESSELYQIYLKYKNNLEKIDEKEDNEYNFSKIKLSYLEEVKKYFETKFGSIKGYDFNLIKAMIQDTDIYKKYSLDLSKKNITIENLLVNFVYLKLTKKPKISFFDSIDDISLSYSYSDYCAGELESIYYCNCDNLSLSPADESNFDYKKYLQEFKKTRVNINTLDNQSGYIYVQSNNTFDEKSNPIYKIGISINPEQRQKQLSSSTSTPNEFTILFFIKCYNYKSLEKQVFEKFNNFRVSKNKEFFSAPYKEIVDFIFHHVKHVRS